MCQLKEHHLIWLIFNFVYNLILSTYISRFTPVTFLRRFSWPELKFYNIKITC